MRSLPSAMIHLTAAKAYCPDAPVEFFIGNLAPDCIDEWKKKDRLHLRDKPERALALRTYARGLDLENPYLKGIVLHLYLDFLWDETPMRIHKEQYTGENWVADYRGEIALTSACLYHRLPWSQDLWKEMEKCPQSKYASHPDYPAYLISDLIHRNGIFHRETFCQPSAVFPPDFSQRFAEDAARSFGAFFSLI